MRGLCSEPWGTDGKSKAGGIFAAAVLILIVVFWFIGSHAKTSPEVKTRTAFDACKQFVGEQLKSPGSAKYPDALSPDVTTVTTVNGKVEVATFISHVDSENGFGALIRSTFSCSVHTVDDGDHWISDGVSINGS